jgi:hypothetical protein
MLTIHAGFDEAVRMKYFVTGATGFIGGRLARKLVEMGHQVVTIARTPSKADDLMALGVEVHKGDITDKESMRAPMTGVDGVYHVAAWYKIGERDTSMAQSINVDGTRNVLELMRELNIPKGVYLSSQQNEISVTGDALQPIQSSASMETQRSSGMNSIFTFQGREIEPTPEEIQACIKGLIEESELQGRVLTHDEIEDARGLLTVGASS